MKKFLKKRRKNREYRECPHSSSCFECPKPDCVEDGKFGYNEILSEDFYDIFLS
ncbi:MAG: hypothetical protein IJP43_10350 [Oscillospiraceae bacterium]|nr:hypothetical protein [Oscillospiraceae bacterium]